MDDKAADRLRHEVYEARLRVSELESRARKLGLEIASDDDIKILSALELIDTAGPLADPVIDGIVRRGETMNVIGSTKEGKSWLIMGMLLSIASGRAWLRHETLQGRVLLIDNELQKPTLSSRLRTVCHAMCISDDVLAPKDQGGQVDVLALRGKLEDVNGIAGRLRHVSRGDYVVIGLDAFYRILPVGTSENDNASMAAVYNTIDQIAESLDATVVMNHHASKGNQTDKRVTDVGSGAGSISRAPDSHLTLREHEKDGLAVMHLAMRSFPPVPAASVRFEFPLWNASDEEPEMRQRKTRAEAKRVADDAAGQETIREALKEATDWLIRNAVRTKAGMGYDRCNRLLRAMVDAKEIESKQMTNPRNKNEMADYFRLKEADKKAKDAAK